MTAPTPARVPAAGTYVVDPAASSVRFSTRHLFGLGPVHGTFAVTAGTITVTADRVEAMGTVDAASVRTGNGARDGQVRSRTYLDVEQHPEITLRASGGHTGPFAGELTARGGTAPVELTVVAVHEDGPVLTVELSTTVDRYAHGITAQKGMTGRHLQLQLTARATRA